MNNVQMLVTAERNGVSVQAPLGVGAGALETLATAVLRYCIDEGASLEAVLAALPSVVCGEGKVVTKPLILTDRNS